MNDTPTPDSSTPVSYALYFRVWIALLTLTIIMIVTESVGVTGAVGATILLGAMFTKASAIMWWFMHLREERRSLAYIVALCIVGTVALLFGLIYADATVGEVAR